jgi:hypothetical protein
VTGIRARRRKQLLGYLKETREAALDRAVWWTGFGRVCGPVVRQTANGKNKQCFNRPPPKKNRCWALYIYIYIYNVQCTFIFISTARDHKHKFASPIKLWHLFQNVIDMWLPVRTSDGIQRAMCLRISLLYVIPGHAYGSGGAPTDPALITTDGIRRLAPTIEQPWSL